TVLSCSTALAALRRSRQAILPYSGLTAWLDQSTADASLRDMPKSNASTKLTVQALTPDLWPALEDLFGKWGAGNGCWCMYWRLGGAYRGRREENKQALRNIVRSGLPPGLLASTATWQWAARRAMRYPGFTTCGGSSVWTHCRSGRSRVSSCA